MWDRAHRPSDPRGTAAHDAPMLLTSQRVRAHRGHASAATPMRFMTDAVGHGCAVPNRLPVAQREMQKRSAPRLHRCYFDRLPHGSSARRSRVSYGRSNIPLKGALPPHPCSRRHSSLTTKYTATARRRESRQECLCHMPRTRTSALRSPYDAAGGRARPRRGGAGISGSEWPATRPNR
jgi:hypothetical protein